jgi:two-component system chemotaxis response regulator CheY
MDQTTISFSGKVMVVDDVPLIRGLLVSILKRLGFVNVLEAPDGVAAWSLLQREEIALVVTDWNMPKMNGLELVKQIRADENLRDTPILMITGGGFKVNPLEAIEAGVDGFLAKPFKAAMLQKYISKVFFSQRKNEADMRNRERGKNHGQNQRLSRLCLGVSTDVVAGVSSPR